MQEKELAFSQLSDIYGFRVITRAEEDCYRVLSAIHQRWRAVPRHFKDYISQPKSNGYRSIHTTVSGRDGQLIEVQIRTREMHEVAESGVAANGPIVTGCGSKTHLRLILRNGLPRWPNGSSWPEDHDEFVEHVNLESKGHQVFCFTPDGHMVKLQKGATPLDFAYAIHTQVGHRCVGSKVDGQRVPLWMRLKNGQSVEVLTAKGQTPQTTWIDIAVTDRAKYAIRKFFRRSSSRHD